MSLPSGYTRLEYIESSGTQYIDTGVQPGNTTKVEMRAQNAATTNTAFFGSATRWKSNGFECFTLISVWANASYSYSSNLNSNNFIDISFGSDGVYKDGAKVATFPSATFASPNSLLLCARIRSHDDIGDYMTGKVASCKIYDNGTLMRDYIPCKNASGVVGMWDNVNSQFYGNAGTGAFTAGPEAKPDLTAHKTLVNGTVYTVQGGKCMVNGTVYDIKKGRTLIGGTGYDILFGSNKIKVTITAPKTGYASVTIDGVRYSSAAELEVEPGTAIKCEVKGSATNVKRYIYRNGELVSSGNAYSMTAEKDVSIELTYTTTISGSALVYHGQINITD